MNLRKMIAIFLVLALLLPLAGCNIASEGKVTVYLVTSESKINAEGVEYARIEYEYDANGNITYQSSFSNGEKQSYEEYVYDEHGNQCSYIKYSCHHSWELFEVSFLESIPLLVAILEKIAPWCHTARLAQQGMKSY